MATIHGDLPGLMLQAWVGEAVYQQRSVRFEIGSRRHIE
ncbi:hypothetical protein JCM19239_2117 [Vibrio variabilis]|uniref:Uncharacterized protein n=1 Tax=Vibrio variabilis TaxID=990271 RepID=A0ABQ0JG78_9VIBR|nr:hypothetical protein JCM19239_2117 [Vibrio variabilis]